MDKITEKDLLKSSKEKLAGQVYYFIANLSPGARRNWIKENMSELLKVKKEAKGNPEKLCREIESFVKASYSGSYISLDNDYYSEHNYYDNYDNEDDENYEEWTEEFTDFMKRTMKISTEGHHNKAVECFSKLFELLKRAGETTDIIGDQGAPEDYVEFNFPGAIAGYTTSLLGTRGKNKLDDILNEILPIAKKYHYRNGYGGLVRALNTEQRAVLKDKLWEMVKTEWKVKEERHAPDEVDGLIALAEAEGDKKEILSIKEQFAKAHAIHLKDVLCHYKKIKNWNSVAKWAQIGLTHFGQHKEYAEDLIKAKENMGDKDAVLEVKLNYFLKNSFAEEFNEVRKYAISVSKWSDVLKTILEYAENEDNRGYRNEGLKLKVLLVEGREKEAFEYMKKNIQKFEIEVVKLLAKYGLTRAYSGKEQSGFKELRTLENRLKNEKTDLYYWLRLIIKNPSGISNIEYAKLSARMYRLLIDFHLNSGKSSRASYAGYYCYIVKELSDLLKEPGLWQELINYMQLQYSKKKLIWEYLRERKII